MSPAEFEYRIDITTEPYLKLLIFRNFDIYDVILTSYLAQLQNTYDFRNR